VIPRRPLDQPDSDEYALWDAAYVLGSLSTADRRAFEAHASPHSKKSGGNDAAPAP
jgi:hypothetical protein